MLIYSSTSTFQYLKSLTFIKYDGSVCLNLALTKKIECINRSPPHLPEVRIREEPFLQVASAVRTEINRAIAILRDVASGRDVKKFIAVSAVKINCPMH